MRICTIMIYTFFLTFSILFAGCEQKQPRPDVDEETITENQTLVLPREIYGEPLKGISKDLLDALDDDWNFDKEDVVLSRVTIARRSSFPIP